MRHMEGKVALSVTAINIQGSDISKCSSEMYEAGNQWQSRWDSKQPSTLILGMIAIFNTGGNSSLELKQ